MISDQTSRPTTTLCSPTFSSSTHLIARCPLCVHLRTSWTCMVGITLRPLCSRGRVPDTYRIEGWVGPRDGLHLLDKKGTQSSADNPITNRPLSRKVCSDLPYSVITCRAELPIGCGLPFAVPTRRFSVLYLSLFIHVLCEWFMLVLSFWKRL